MNIQHIKQQQGLSIRSFSCNSGDIIQVISCFPCLCFIVLLQLLFALQGSLCGDTFVKTYGHNSFLGFYFFIGYSRSFSQIPVAYPILPFTIHIISLKHLHSNPRSLLSTSSKFQQYIQLLFLSYFLYRLIFVNLDIFLDFQMLISFFNANASFTIMMLISDLQ